MPYKLCTSVAVHASRITYQEMQPILEVTDRDGWHKEVPLQKSVVMIGSDPNNDVPLPEVRGQGVERRHLQLLMNPQDGGNCRVVNMASKPIELTTSGQTVFIAPTTAMMIGNESVLRLGEYQLVLRLYGGSNFQPTPAYTNGNSTLNTPFMRPAPATPTFTMPAMPTAPAIAPNAPPFTMRGNNGPVALGVMMLRPQLSEEQDAEVVITIANRGEKTAVQFKLTIEGFPGDSYEIPPLPLLFPGAEKTIPLTLSYPKGKPLTAGSHAVRFIATAPDAYPGEQAVVTQNVIIPTVYAHEVRLREL